jgi:extradiol dioxygenase family protein
MRCDICIDVNDVAEAVRFYGEGIGAACGLLLQGLFPSVRTT